MSMIMQGETGRCVPHNSLPDGQGCIYAQVVAVSSCLPNCTEADSPFCGLGPCKEAVCGLTLSSLMLSFPYAFVVAQLSSLHPYC